MQPAACQPPPPCAGAYVRALQLELVTLQDGAARRTAGSKILLEIYLPYASTAQHSTAAQRTRPRPPTHAPAHLPMRISGVRPPLLASCGGTCVSGWSLLAACAIAAVRPSRSLMQIFFISLSSFATSPDAGVSHWLVE